MIKIFKNRRGKIVISGNSYNKYGFELPNGRLKNHLRYKQITSPTEIKLDSKSNLFTYNKMVVIRNIEGEYLIIRKNFCTKYKGSLNRLKKVDSVILKFK